MEDTFVFLTQSDIVYKFLHCFLQARNALVLSQKPANKNKQFNQQNIDI